MKKDNCVVVIGAGIAGLSTAALLAYSGKKVTVLERNWLPGGCASSYPRKHFVFESGATTLVGLSEGMPVQFLLDTLGIELPAWQLQTPMQVHLKNGEILTRYQDLDQWIAEAERVFGPEGQRPFWEKCFKISRFVWETSIEQRAFPPQSLSDLGFAIQHFKLKQLPFAALAFKSTRQLLADYDLDKNPLFVDFVNEQLLITAQNYLDEVNVLFGATALCYTNFPNFYLPGGLVKLSEALIAYLESKGGSIELRHEVTAVTRTPDGFLVHSPKGDSPAGQVVSALPMNNTAAIFEKGELPKWLNKKVLGSSELRSAFQMGIVFRPKHRISCIHHQIHLKEPLPGLGAASIFLSMSHPDDHLRCGPDEVVASVSTHVFDPENTLLDNKHVLEEKILEILESHGFLERSEVIYQHSSTPHSWQKWTGRAWGQVGGYPQFARIKPWQMAGARLEKGALYQCGDSTYPGQGIPGACLSGIIAWQKMMLDGVLR